MPDGGLSAENRARAEAIVALYPQARSALVPLCHLAQSQHGYLTEASMEDIAKLVGCSPAEVRGTASFYDMLHTEPVGRYVFAVCTNIACMLAGAYEVLSHAEERLGIRVGQTTHDELFTLEEAECLAGCDKAVCVQVNHRFFGPIDEEAFDQLVDDLAAGHLADTVPPHGVLNRVSRAVGLPAKAAKAAKAAAAGDAGDTPPNGSRARSGT
ncbi:MAG: NAD(P)H-dependent oxidoreductase subunit E [Acidimicrobiales bacterium]|jgi:NADH-quinone oxidoreductase E subunit